MLFAHTDEYPGEPPLVKLRSEKGLSDARVAKAVAVVEEQMEELAGMPMIYNLITAAREWLVAAVSDVSARLPSTL